MGTQHKLSLICRCIPALKMNTNQRESGFYYRQWYRMPIFPSFSVSLSLTFSPQAPPYPSSLPSLPFLTSWLTGWRVISMPFSLPSFSLSFPPSLFLPSSLPSFPSFFPLNSWRLTTLLLACTLCFSFPKWNNNHLNDSLPYSSSALIPQVSIHFPGKYTRSRKKNKKRLPSRGSPSGRWRKERVVFGRGCLQ